MVTSPPEPAGGGAPGPAAPPIGVLSVQGAFAAHEQVLRALGASPVQVREPADLDGLVGLVLPGGESTTITLVAKANGLWDELAKFVAGGAPVLATCAGGILLATEILDGRAGQDSLGAVDMAVRRNGFGRQVDSFEVEVPLAGDERPFPGVFIRAPVIERVGGAVEVLARVHRGGADSPVLCRDRHVTVCTFHPELTADPRVHRAAFRPVLPPGPPAGPDE
jgi:5'-phosphate synthase pdxT subunit